MEQIKITMSLRPFREIGWRTVFFQRKDYRYPWEAVKEVRGTDETINSWLEELEK